MMLQAGRCGPPYTPCAAGTSYLTAKARAARCHAHHRRPSRCLAVPSSRAPLTVEEDLTPADGEVIPLETPLLPAASSAYGDFRAFVAGATGGTGRAIVQRLLQEGVHVRALVRDPAAAASLLPASAELYQGDVFQFSTLHNALGDANVMFIATGSRPALDPFGPFQIDYEGTVNLVEIGKRAGVKRIVLVSSIGADEPFFPLNLLFGVLFWKKRGEEALQRSGVPYTIVRPGGLLNEPRQGQVPGNIVMTGPNTFGLPPKRTPGSILRRQVADICVESLTIKEAENKVVEVVTSVDELARPNKDWFASV